MTDFFKNALGMFGTAGAKEDNEFVGQLVEVGSQRLRIKRVIAEGESHTQSVELVTVCLHSSLSSSSHTACPLGVESVDYHYLVSVCFMTQA